MPEASWLSAADVGAAVKLLHPLVTQARHRPTLARAAIALAPPLPDASDASDASDTSQCRASRRLAPGAAAPRPSLTATAPA